MPPEAAVADAPVSVAPDTGAPQSATVEAPFNDAFSDLDNMLKNEPDDTTPPDNKGKSDDKAATDKAKTGADSKPEKGKEGLPRDSKTSPDAGQKAGEKVEGSKTEADKTAGTEVGGKKPTPWQLVHKYEAELSQAKKELAEARGGSPKDHPDFKALTDQLKQEREARQELENKIRFVSYKDSAEFKEKFEKPYVDAWISGRSRVAKMTVIANSETGETRAGTPEDFDTLMKIGSDDDAAEFAATHFGSKASVVMYHRERVQELSGNADRAVEEYRTKGSEQEKQTREQHEAFAKSVGGEVSQIWKSCVDTATEKYPQWSKPVEGDANGNAFLERGMALANKAFSSFNVYDPRLTKEQRAEMVKVHAAVFNKAAWFDRLAYQKSAVEKELAAARKELEQYKASEPGSGSGRRGSSKTEDVAQSWENALEQTAV